MKKLAVLPLAALVFAAACSDTMTSPMADAPNGANLSVTVVPGDGSPCLNTGGGWTKIDNNSGSAGGAWGSFSYPKGNTITYDVKAGFTLELCIKSGEKVGGNGTGEGSLRVTIVGAESGTISTPQGLTQDISHTSFRWTGQPTQELQALDVSKGATTRFERDVQWELSKTVNGGASASFSGVPGQTFNANWAVAATKTRDLLSNYSITGSIIITNPNPVDVDVAVTDEMDVGTVELTCPSRTVPGNGGTLTCTYTTGTLSAQPLATLNTATVVVDQNSYEAPEGYTGSIRGGVATAEIEWGNPVLTRHDPSPLFVDIYKEIFNQNADITETTPLSATEPFVCPAANSGQYNENDTFTAPASTNTATLTGEENKPNLSESATVNLSCRIPRGQASLEVGMVTVSGKRGSDAVSGSFQVRNVSSGGAFARLTGAEAQFTAILKGGTRDPVGSCTVSSGFPTWLAAMNTPGDRATFTYSCKLNKPVPSTANELQALVQVKAEDVDAHGRKFVKTFSNTGTQKF